METTKEKDNFTYYFIESHLKEIGHTEIILESSAKYLSPIRKIIEKEMKDKNNADFIVSVYAINFRPNLIKPKEIKEVEGIKKAIYIKLCLKNEKNKFETQIYINIEEDNFNPVIKFSDQKKIIGKDVPAPIQYILSPLEIMETFVDAIANKEQKNINDSTYRELLRFGLSLIKDENIYDLVLFLMIYVDILKTNDLELIKAIFDIFKLEKLIKPLNPRDIFIFHEKLDVLYRRQIEVFEIIKKIQNCNLDEYLIKFYTIYINTFFTVQNYEDCERLLTDLRDNNPFDKDILPKLYFSEYAKFYRSIPISNNLKFSLIGKFINSSINYQNLLTSFSLISEYIKGDFVNMLLIIVENFDKIFKICTNSEKPLNIKDFIIQNVNDDLTKVQYHLDFLIKKKLEYNFKMIHFDKSIWDFYINNNNNNYFWEYLKVNLIEASLCYDDIIDALTYISKFLNYNFIEILDLIVKEYDKLRMICMKENKQINIADFIKQNSNDDIKKIKENLSFIIVQKLKDQYEIIFFNINIWNYYIFNHYKLEFLVFLEKKLYESIISTKDVYDCLIFSSNFKK